MLTASEAAISAAFHTASAGRTQNSLASTADTSVQFGHPFEGENSFIIQDLPLTRSATSSPIEIRRFGNWNGSVKKKVETFLI